VFLIARLLADGPVADSWIHLRAIKRIDAGVDSRPRYCASGVCTPNENSAKPGFALILMGLLAIGLIMLAPLFAVMACFVRRFVSGQTTQGQENSTGLADAG
jgi:hypothetical protein